MIIYQATFYHHYYDEVITKDIVFDCLIITKPQYLWFRALEIAMEYVTEVVTLEKIELIAD